MQLIGVTMAATALVSVLIFERSIKGGVTLRMESGHIKTFKGEEYETTLTISAKGEDWMGPMPTDFAIETGLLTEHELLPGGRVRLKFLGRYAGRSNGVRVAMSLTDPLKLFSRPDKVASADFLLDTLPLSLLAPAAPRRMTVFGFGEETTGYPGPGQELYGLDEYHAGDSKDIVWKRVAKSPDERLVMKTKETNVRETMTVGFVQFAERGGDRAPWIDLVCEAIAQIGKQAFEMGAEFTLLYGPSNGEGSEPVRASATNVVQLAEAVMSCSAAAGTRDVDKVVAYSDFVVTGLKELEDTGLAQVVSQRPMLLIDEAASPASVFQDRSVVYSGKESLATLVRRLLETRT